MTDIALQDGQVVFTDGKVGTGLACCCGCDCYSPGGYRPAVETLSGRGLVWLSFDACIGSGVAGTVDAPHATNPCDFEGLKGPLTGVTLTNGGSGYARLGRVQPTITASVTGGTGATLSVTLDEESEFLGDGCMPAPWWKVLSVAVTSGGSGYADGADVTFSAAGGDTTIHAASGKAYVDIDDPENEIFTITTAGGSGAVLQAVWTVAPEDVWGTRPNNPCPAPKKRTYRLDSVNIISPGSGYQQFDEIEISFPTADDGVVLEHAYIDVDSVDGTGAITGIFVAVDPNSSAGPAGRYVGSLTDEIDSVVVNSCLINGDGKYYREDASEPPYVATVTVTVNQELPSTGSGATVTATVEDDTSDPDFGKVVSLTLTNGGTDYLDVPLACTVPDRLYISWGATTVEVTLAEIFAGLAFVANICDNGQGPDLFTPPCETAGDVGNTSSRAIAQIQAFGCLCSGKLHIRSELYFTCRECYAVDNTRTNIGRTRVYCLRFEVDGDGCPVGDAQVVFVEESELYYSDDGNAPIDVPCQNPADSSIYPIATCPCDYTCDQNYEPTISLLPP